MILNTNKLLKRRQFVEKEFNLTIKDVIEMPDWEFDLMRETLEQEGNEEALIKLEDLLDRAVMIIEKRNIDQDKKLSKSTESLAKAYDRYAESLNKLAEVVDACSNSMFEEFEKCVHQLSYNIPNLVKK